MVLLGEIEGGAGQHLGEDRPRVLRALGLQRLERRGVLLVNTKLLYCLLQRCVGSCCAQKDSSSASYVTMAGSNHSLTVSVWSPISSYVGSAVLPPQ